ncbi:unnamed protein product [Fraxinus pennsylvanica]|uniref:Trehalose-6-phosphate synthase n=1 Tax=Fraxinus pennsylvanica TaxID=56036 RepID=A0AAD2EDG8_9LAMI|nr:unnamed protein product [Fraxinus pennsylvanica]
MFLNDRSLDFHALCALYAITDVALVTSLRDGMNPVSYEFVACRASKKGVLILSEFAGAAQSLGAEAILVNPWNVTEVAASIGYALNMPADEREKRHHHNFMHVNTHTSQEWAETFISELNDTIVEAQLRTRQIRPLLPKREATECFLKSNNRLLILHLLTGPISNASVDVVQGGRSVEVRAVSVTKASILGAAIDRILGEIVHHNDVKAPIDHVLCIGHFVPKACDHIFPTL